MSYAVRRTIHLLCRKGRSKELDSRPVCRGERKMKTGTAAAKKMLKKEALFEAAYELFTQQGVAETSISDITSRAGIAKGTFYLYFQNKDDLRDQLAFRKALAIVLQCFNKTAQTDPPVSFEDRTVFLAETLADKLAHDLNLLSFITENMGWNFLMQDMKTQKEDYAEYFRMTHWFLSGADRQYSDPYAILCACIGFVANTLYSCLILNHREYISSVLTPMKGAVRGLIRSQKISD